MSQRFYKDPDAILDYAIDWSAWLDGDTIAESTWQADEGIEIESHSHTLTTTTVWLAGGTADKRYRVTNRIVTAGGRIDDRTLYVWIVER